MEKKTKFKLNFIKSHLQKPKIHKQTKHHPKSNKPLSDLSVQSVDQSNPLLLLKYFNPIQFHRVIGDIVFLDRIPNDTDEIIGLSSLWNSFKSIKDIKVSPNFLLCSYEDSGEFSHVGLLTDRLKSMGNAASYELAIAIEKYIEFFTGVPYAKRENPDQVILKNSQLQFNLFIKKHENDPMIFYHYRLGEAVRTKIGVNKLLKEISFQDDIKMFEGSLFVVPTRDYFNYMKNHLKACFGGEEQPVKLYLNSVLGIKMVYGICQCFLLGDEKIVILSFPKEYQSDEIKRLYETLEKKTENKIIIEKKEKETTLCKNFVYKNLETWENLMKQYFEPWTGNVMVKQCSLIKQEKNSSYLKLMGSSETETVVTPSHLKEEFFC